MVRWARPWAGPIIPRRLGLLLRHHPPCYGAFQYLRAEKNRQTRNRLAAGPMWDDPWDLVFTNELGRYLIFQTFHTHFKKIAESIGRPDARPHDLRRTATRMQDHFSKLKA